MRLTHPDFLVINKKTSSTEISSLVKGKCEKVTVEEKYTGKNKKNYQTSSRWVYFIDGSIAQTYGRPNTVR